jgi:hypothetical protein
LGHRDRKLALKALVLGLALACGLGLGACRKQEEKPHRTAPWLAHPDLSSSATPGMEPLELQLSNESRVRFKLVGRKGQVSGSAPVAQGTLRVDPRDLTRSSGSFSVDLSALSVDPVDNPPSNASPRETALDWLELGPEVAADKREQFRFARFELTAVEGWSGRPVAWRGHKFPSQRLTAVGTLLLHGFRAPIRADVVLDLLAGTATPQLSIHSGSTLVLPLAPHDIGPRGPGGVVDAVETARAREALGSSVRLEVELVAHP